MYGRALLLTIFAMFVISMMITRTITRSSTAQTDNMVKFFEHVSAKNIAHDGINLALRQLAYNPKWRTGLNGMSVSGGKVTVTLLDTSFRTQPAIKVTSVASVTFSTALYSLSGRDTTFTSIVFLPKGLFPGNFVRGAFTAHNDVQTNGNYIIDGRDHDTSGSTIFPGQGTYGIWTSGPIVTSGSGNTAITGTNMRFQDFPLPNKGIADTSIVRQNQATSSPTTPDSVMGGTAFGFPEGRLKAIAKGVLVPGSRYVDSTSMGTFSPINLMGVTYVEPGNSGPNSTWNPTFNISGSGILVVHNATRSSVMKLAGGLFKGIIIIDDVDKFHMGVIGSVFSLTTGLSSGNVIGNGNANNFLYFSTAAISQAISSVKADSNVVTYTNKILGWYE